MHWQYSEQAMNNITISPILPEYYEGFAAICNEYILQGTSTMEESPYDKGRVKKIINHLGDREAAFVLLKGTEMIGYSVIKKYSDREGYRFACETSTYLTKSETGKGYGTYLKKWIMAHCKALGYHHIVAKIFATNQVSIHYNLKLGYEIVGTQKEIGYKHGRWVDVVIMQYLIK